MPRGIFERYADYALRVDQLYQPMIQGSIHAQGQIAGQAADRVSRLLDQRSRLATEQARRKEMAQRGEMYRSELALRREAAQTRQMELELRKQMKEIAAAKEGRESNPAWVQWEKRGQQPVRRNGRWEEPTVGTGNKVDWRPLDPETEADRIKALEERQKTDPFNRGRSSTSLDRIELDKERLDLAKEREKRLATTSKERTALAKKREERLSKTPPKLMSEWSRLEHAIKEKERILYSFEGPEAGTPEHGAMVEELNRIRAHRDKVWQAITAATKPGSNGTSMPAEFSGKLTPAEYEMLRKAGKKDAEIRAYVRGG